MIQHPLDSRASRVRYDIILWALLGKKQFC